MQSIEVSILVESVNRILEAAGFSEASAGSMASSLVTADMMGHTTHGLELLPWYLAEHSAGNVESVGEPTLVEGNSAIHRWDGHRLPGAYVLDRVIDQALMTSDDTGIVVSTVANTFHNGALVTYLPRIAAEGKMGILVSSGPGARGVAPHGSSEPVYTPNPLSAVIPTASSPILVDISSSVTTMNRVKQYAKEGWSLPLDAAITSSGNATTSARLLADGRGALLPLGGMANGHKGFGLALIIEALTQSLTGVGRQFDHAPSTVNTTLLLFSPEAFAGDDAFLAASSFIAEQCRNASPIDPDRPVRVPGDRSWAKYRHAKEAGVEVSFSMIQRLRNLAEYHGTSISI